MPIITCVGKNKAGEMATDIAIEEYCSTKNMYYFGFEHYTLAVRRKGTIQFPKMIILFSNAASKVMHTIESFFNWLN